MLLAELDYHLPSELIAARPPPERDGARMLVVPEGPPEHAWFRDWPERVPSDALVVLNDSRVMHCRLLGQRAETGGKVELLLLEPAAGGQCWLAMARASKPLRRGDVVRVGNAQLEVVDKAEGGTWVMSSSVDFGELMAEAGHVPLPPYVRRPDELADRDRYQTVFARSSGSAAAPTAGLHLTEDTLGRLRSRGVAIAFSTLHVGAGTFRPVSAARVEDHPMHSEHYEIGEPLEEAVRCARQRGAPIIAVGTTVVRALESAATEDGHVRSGSARTRLLITPGYRFRVVDALLTNFHTPKSTLLALVQAFAGSDRIRRAYGEAVAARYRFLSYGDAMWIPMRRD